MIDDNLGDEAVDDDHEDGYGDHGDECHEMVCFCHDDGNHMARSWS